MADYTKMEIKTYDDFIAKTGQQEITQCTSNKVARDFGLDLDLALDFCLKVKDLQTCLNTEDTEGSDSKLAGSINTLLDTTVSSYADKVDVGFEAWNSSPKTLDDVCKLINSIQSFSDGFSISIGAVYSKAYSLVMKEFNKITFESILDEIYNTLTALAVDLVCGALNDAMNCLKEKLSATPWDCLSTVDASNLEALRTFDADLMCKDILGQIADKAIAIKAGMNRVMLQSAVSGIKAYPTFLMNAATTSVNNIASLGSLVSLKQMSMSSCRDIANVVDTVVNSSVLGAQVAISQVIYNDFKFLSSLDPSKLATDLFDCMELDDDIFDLCAIGEKMLDISSVLEDFTSAMFTDLNKLCSIVDTLDKKLNNRTSSKNVLEYMDDRHIPLRNNKSLSALDFILKLEENLNDNTYKRFDDWAKNLDIPDCVDMPLIIKESLPYSRASYTTEDNINNMSEVYYQNLKCLYDPIEYEKFIDSINESVDDLIDDINTKSSGSVC